MILTCIEVLLGRMLDVSLGTIRTYYSVKGKVIISSIIAFIEILIWYFVAKETLVNDISSFWIPIFYALGYSLGTLIGTYIASNIIKGTVSIEVITKKDNHNLINKIRKKGYGLSIISLKNDYDEIKKEMFIIESSKKSLSNVIKIIKKEDKNAFIVVNETKLVHNGLIK